MLLNDVNLTMKNLIVFSFIIFITGCGVSKNFTPAKKYSPQQLQADYTLFQNILEELQSRAIFLPNLQLNKRTNYRK